MGFAGRVWLVGALVLVLLLTACQGSRPTETALFEEAELHYRVGNYDSALQGYQSFLRTYPMSPLARTAEMRLRNIHREVNSLMNRQGMPRPVYHGSKLTQSETLAPASARPSDPP